MKLLQSHLVGGTPEAHVQWMLDQMRPEEGAHICDMGCGYGEVSRIMATLRPDLHFTLVNRDYEQLSQCPKGPQFKLVHRDFTNTSLPSRAYDHVMFNYALWYAPLASGLGEASRLLKDHGKLFLYEVTGDTDVQPAFMQMYGISFQSPEVVKRALLSSGFEDVILGRPVTSTSVCESWLREQGDGLAYDLTFRQMHPMVATASRIVRTPPMIEDVLRRHQRVALQLSGGKDSVATLYLLRDYLDRITVYWANTGDTTPEVVDIVNECRRMAPNFVEVNSDVHTWRMVYGNPVDLFPTTASPTGRMLGFGEDTYSDRFSCCEANVMRPLQQAMQRDGVTCVIRGQKSCDMDAPPLLSGDVVHGVEYVFPIQEWSHQQVLDYLADVGAPVNSVYEQNYAGVDCLHCTAWWPDNHQKYRERMYPEAHKAVREVHQKLYPALSQLCSALEDEIGG